MNFFNRIYLVIWHNIEWILLLLLDHYFMHLEWWVFTMLCVLVLGHGLRLYSAGIARGTDMVRRMAADVLDTIIKTKG